MRQAGLGSRSCSAPCCTPDAFQIPIGVKRTALALGTPERFAQTLKDGVFSLVHVKTGTQLVVGGANSRRLIDADLIGDGQVQGEMKKGVHLSAFRSEFLLNGGLQVFQQGVVFRMLFDQVGSRRFGAFEHQAFAVFAPGFAEKNANLLT